MISNENLTILVLENSMRVTLSMGKGGLSEKVTFNLKLEGLEEGSEEH